MHEWAEEIFRQSLLVISLVSRADLCDIPTQAPGPQVEANKKMYKQVKTMRHFEAASLPSLTVPTMAMRNSQTSMPAAPSIRSIRRPNFSMVQKEIGVEPTLTAVVIIAMTKAFLIPTVLKKVVP